MTKLPPRGEWTSEELGEIDRIRAVCVKHGDLELECSHTDEGDPWCVVYDQTRGRIVLHIARIDRCYFIVSPPRTKSARATTMSQAVEIALHDLEQVIA